MRYSRILVGSAALGRPDVRLGARDSPDVVIQKPSCKSISPQNGVSPDQHALGDRFRIKAANAAAALPAARGPKSLTPQPPNAGDGQARETTRFQFARQESLAVPPKHLRQQERIARGEKPAPGPYS